MFYILSKLTLFLSGGAGVGKSRLTNALYEALVRYLDSPPGKNPDEIKVLEAAPTGKAAYLIGGNTLHAIFNIPINREFQYTPLHPDVLNTKRSQLKNLGLFSLIKFQWLEVGCLCS